MSAGDRPAMLLALDDAWLWPRREAFSQAHPGTRFTRLGVMAQACVPRGNGIRTITRASLGDVLDALEEIYGPSVGQATRQRTDRQRPPAALSAVTRRARPRWLRVRRAGIAAGSGPVPVKTI